MVVLCILLQLVGSGANAHANAAFYRSCCSCPRVFLADPDWCIGDVLAGCTQRPVAGRIISTINYPPFPETRVTLSRDTGSEI
ncbi:hypothetical protein F5141DRAFT_863 [Pisolithus sp. B1]|nr:hypothetical protein F5141DRAFT_863 [Pisolithus sp. B1]